MGTKPLVVRLELTWQDYNYLRTSLWQSIANDRKTIEEHGRNFGNIAYLHDYSVRLHTKLEKQFEASRKAQLGAKGYRENKRAVAKIIKTIFERGR